MIETIGFNLDIQKQEMIGRVAGLIGSVDNIIRDYGDTINRLGAKYQNKKPANPEEEQEYILSRKPLELKLAVTQFDQLLKSDDNEPAERPGLEVSSIDERIRSNDHIMADLQHEIEECRKSLELMKA